MRVVFMGSPEFAGIILEELVASGICEIVGVFSQPDKPSGRKQLLTPCHVSESAIKLALPLFRPVKLKDDENINTVRILKPDYIVVAAYGQVLPKEILDIAPCINLHTSALPRHRGAAALQSLILADEPYAVVTAIMMDVKLDVGDILGQLFFKHQSDARFECLLRRLGFLAANLIKDILLNYKNIKPLRQIGTDASYAKKITKEDGLVTLDNAKHLYLKYKAYYPWPGVYLQDGLKLKEVEIIDEKTAGRAGVISSIDADSVVVECCAGKIKILKLQPQSKNEMDAASYIRGKRLGVGDSIL